MQVKLAMVKLFYRQSYGHCQAMGCTSGFHGGGMISKGSNRIFFRNIIMTLGNFTVVMGNKLKLLADLTDQAAASTESVLSLPSPAAIVHGL